MDFTRQKESSFESNQPSKSFIYGEARLKQWTSPPAPCYVGGVWTFFTQPSIRQRQLYYVDKSLLIEELWNKPAQAMLLPRPRRFGKSLNLSMLRYFFENTPESNASLFEGLAIAEKPEFLALQGQYPVIFLTFKDVKQLSPEVCFEKIQRLLFEEFLRHRDLCEPALMDREQEEWNAILDQRASVAQQEGSLRFLMSLLYRATGRKVILLLDEYDTPIHAGYQHGYYEEVVSFMRGLLGAALKDNPFLEKSVMTGILRVARESIFSGLNNLAVYSLLDQRFSEYFGFTEAEAEQLLADFDLTGQRTLVREWYNGYRFGQTTIYNPWSILQFIDQSEEGARPYWVNTSANELARDLITRSDPTLRSEVEILLAGGTIQSPLNDNIVLGILNSITRPSGIFWSSAATSSRSVSDGNRPGSFMNSPSPIWKYAIFMRLPSGNG